MTTNKSTGSIINIANILTVFRVFLIFPAVLFVVWSVPFHLVYALLIFIVASYTDHLDGMIARKYGYITDFGKILDPLADKLMIISVLISFCFLGFCPVLPVILVALREVLITIVRMFVLRSNNKVIPANKWGKFKTISQIFAVCFILLVQIFNENGIISLSVSNILSMASILLLWLSVIFSWISGITYLCRV